MSSKTEKLFTWILILLLFIGLSLTGAFSRWITFIPLNPAVGWSIFGAALAIFGAALATDLFRSWLKSPEEDPSRHQRKLDEWEKVREKGKLHYVLMHEGRFGILAVAVIIIFLQMTNQLGEYQSLNLYTFTCDVAILAAIYGAGMRDWQMREEEYKSLRRATDAV